MESSCQGRDNGAAEQLRRTESLAGSRGCTGLRIFPAPFKAPDRTRRKNSLAVKSSGALSKCAEKGKEALLLPNLYSAMKHIAKEKARLPPSFEADSGDVTELPVFAVRPTPTREKQSKLLNSSYLLRGNSLEVEISPPQKLGKPKHLMESASRSSAVRFKQQFSSNSRLQKRSTISMIDPAPAITLSLIETEVQEAPDPRVMRANTLDTHTFSNGNLLNPPAAFRRDSSRHSTGSLRTSSPLSSVSSECSSGESLMSGNTSDADNSLDLSFDLQKPGVWSPWANHLTPFQEVIEVAGNKHSKIYHYLKKRRNVVHTEYESMCLLDVTFNPRAATIRDGIACTCPHPLTSRNLRRFLVQGISRLSLNLNSRKLNRLQAIFPAKTSEIAAKVLLIQVDGVLADIRKIDPFDLSSFQYLLRAGTVDGLRHLSRSFSIVLLSALSPLRFQRILEYLAQRKVNILAAYCIQQIQSDERHIEQRAMSFLDYSPIYEDLGIKANQVSARVLVLGALLAETTAGEMSTGEELLYSAKGLGIRLHAKHWPVVLPSQPAPAVTMLVPHLMVEDYKAALTFTAVAKEVIRINRASKSAKWDDSFQYLCTYDSSPHLAYIRTNKVMEAYFAYLLPWVRSEEWACDPFSVRSQPAVCYAHPSAQQVSILIPETRAIVVSAVGIDYLSPCSFIYSEPFNLQTKVVTLLEYAANEDTG